LREEAKDAVAVLPHLLPSPEEEEVSLSGNRSGRSGSPREWLGSGRATGRAIVGQQVGQQMRVLAAPPTCYNPSGTDVIEPTSIRRAVEFASIGCRNGILASFDFDQGTRRLGSCV
jgi:hypothetical protein